MFPKSITITAALLIGLFFLTVSCDNSLSSFDNHPPVLPPVSSMEIDFSEFEQEHSSEFSAMELVAESESYSHFGNAAIRALVMKTVVNLNVAIPKILLKAAEQTEPQQNASGEWVWSYSRTADDKNFEVRLVATRINDNEVRWQLFITNPNLGFDNHLFFEGSTTQGGRNGTWTYYQLLGGGSGDPVSEIQWHIEDDDRRQLKLEILTDRNGHLGDNLEYEYDAPDKRLRYYNAEQDETTEIGWNTDTREGYLVAPNYNEGTRACWDASLVNTPCS